MNFGWTKKSRKTLNVNLSEDSQNENIWKLIFISLYFVGIFGLHNFVSEHRNPIESLEWITLMQCYLSSYLFTVYRIHISFFYPSTSFQMSFFCSFLCCCCCWFFFLSFVFHSIEFFLFREFIFIYLFFRWYIER